MGQKEKLIAKLKSSPRDFTFEDAESLLGYFSYRRSNKGRTSGSRVMFTSEVHKTKILGSSRKAAAWHRKKGSCLPQRAMASA